MADILLGNVKGPQGNDGNTGAQGPQGEAATIEVGTVSTTAYGNMAQVTNSGTESAAVFDFVIPQGKPGEQTTKMGALTLDTVTASSESFPIPATGETGSTVFGKIIKFFNDAKTAINSKVNISDIVNNLTSTATNKPLSAAQGKALNDALTTTSGNLAPLLETVNSVVSWDGTGGAARNNYAIRFGKVVIISYNVYNISLPAQGQYFHISSALAPSGARYIGGYFINASGGAAVPCVYVVGTDGNITLTYSSSITASQFAIYGAYII